MRARAHTHTHLGQIISVVVFASLTQLVAVSGGLIGSGMRGKDLDAMMMGYYTLTFVRQRSGSSR